MLGFVGFAMFGFFTSLAPQFVSGQLGIHSFMVSGALAFGVFAASAVAQMFSARLGARVQEVLGTALLAAGLVLVVVAIVATVLSMLVVGGILAGAGVGVTFKFAIGSVLRIAPEESKGETLAGLFLGGYFGMSVPVMLLGLVLQILPLGASAALFGAAVLVLLVVAAVVSHRTRLAAAGA
jgi:MFS family permease